MEVEIIKAKGAGEDTSTGRKIDRLRVAAYCRVRACLKNILSCSF